MNSELSKIITKGLNYTAEEQNDNGSWSGPISGRLYETLLIAISHEYVGITTPKKTLAFINKEKPQTYPSDALFLEEGLKTVFENSYLRRKKTIFEKIKKDLFQRKYLLLITISYTKNIISKAEVYTFKKIISSKIKTLKKAKGWDLLEYMIISAILYDNVEETKILKLYKKLPKNVISTCLLAIYFKKKEKKSLAEEILAQARKYMLKNGSFSYYEIPIWDTALNLGAQKKYLPKKTIESGLEYIKINVNKDGGWGFIPNSPSELDTTSLIIAYLNNELPKKTINHSIKLLKKTQLDNGLWPVWKKNENPSIEVVAHIIWSIKMANAKNINTQSSKKWLQEKVKENRIMSDWCLNLPYSILSILRSNPGAVIKNKLNTVLLKTQNKDGGWGYEKGKESNASATANALSSLIYVNDNTNSSKKAMEFLVKTIQKDGSWEAPKEVFGPHPLLYSIKASCHAFCMESLIKYRESKT